ncbi:hypothetical protein J4461_01430 [Candidatus Pacearchaeota archaeon]|nr:hypothetical protein [Candidatus Pacearchaeota archaeon]
MGKHLVIPKSVYFSLMSLTTLSESSNGLIFWRYCDEPGLFSADNFLVTAQTRGLNPFFISLPNRTEIARLFNPPVHNFQCEINKEYFRDNEIYNCYPFTSCPYKIENGAGSFMGSIARDMSSYLNEHPCSWYTYVSPEGIYPFTLYSSIDIQLIENKSAPSSSPIESMLKRIINNRELKLESLTLQDICRSIAA